MGPYHARAMGNPLRDRRTAAELASDGQVIEIAGKISYFESLASIIEADLAALDPDKMPSGWRDCAVLGDLQFGFVDEKRRIPMVSGRVTADVAAVCQRCLEPFQLQLEIEPELLLLEIQQSADGYDDYEVWELDEQTMQPQDIVEELLIMAMPFSAMHDNMADCRVFLSADSSDDPADDDGTEKLVKPFAALRSQMK
jgi:uncharacterized metal-binding protein YceD (DUF177 family)